MPRIVMKPAFLPVSCFSAELRWHLTWLTFYWGIHILADQLSDSILTGFYIGSSPPISMDPVGSPSRHIKASLDHNVTPLTSCKCLRAPTSLLCGGVH